MDYRPTPPQLKTEPFEIAALLCGIASFVLCCTGVLGMVFGALGILFFSLCSGAVKVMSPIKRTAVILSGVGLALSIILMIWVFSDPEMQKQFVETYAEYYNDYYYNNH